MKKARLFKSDEVFIVDAQDVADCKVDRNSEFTDIEYEFKVQFVIRAKNNGGPYFRLYMSREAYKNLSEDERSRYDILREMRHYKESEWHRHWEEVCKPFCSIEKFIYAEDNRYKRADAFNEEYNVCIEFQHSYIDWDFEIRNNFYEHLGINVIWLYDLTKQEVLQKDNGECHLLEDNSKGFFKISENEQYLKSNRVYIQDKKRNVYRVNHLNRLNINNGKSTIRSFLLTEVYTEHDFIECLRTQKFKELGVTICENKLISNNSLDSIINIFGRNDNIDVGVFYNTNTGWYFEVSRHAVSNYKITGKVYGKMSRKRVTNYAQSNYSKREIYGADEKIWKLIWCR